MSKNLKLQLHQFKVTRESVIDRKIYIYHLPEELRDYRANNSKEKNSFLSSLGKLIFRDCIEVIDVNSSYSKSSPYWVASLERIEPKRLLGIIRDWIKRVGVSSLKASKILIEEPKIIGTKDLFDEENKNLIYRLLHKVYLYELTTEGINLADSPNLRFHSCLEGLERDSIISDPIVQGKKPPFSYNIGSQTVSPLDGNNEIYINFDISIKSWMHKSSIDLKKKKTYLLSGDSYGFYVHDENRYANEKGKKVTYMNFKRHETEYFSVDNPTRESLNLLGVNLMDVLVSPKDYLEGDRSVFIIEKNKNMRPAGKGAGLPERRDLIRYIEKKFPNLELRGRLNKCSQESTVGRYKRVNIGEIGLNSDDYSCFGDRKVDEDKFDKLVGSNLFYKKPPVYMGVRKNKIIIDIFSDDERLKEVTLELLSVILRLENKNNGDIFNLVNGDEIHVRFRGGDLTKGLSSEEQKNKNLRTQKVGRVLDESISPDCALIDIMAFENNKKEDPKELLRKSFGRNGVATQFINGYDEIEDGQRNIKVVNALYDLLSTQGFIHSDYIAEGYDDTTILSIGVVANTGGKLAVLSRIDERGVYFKRYDIKEEWMIFNELIKTIHLKDYSNLKTYGEEGKRIKRDFDNWIVREINAISKSKRKVKVYFDANLRSKFWNFATNGNLKIEKLRILNRELVKFVRINDTIKVPKYNIYKSDEDIEGINKSMGLFESENNVYYSVGARSDNMQAKNTFTKREVPSKFLQLQGLLEIATLSENRDKLGLLASEVHSLRHMSISTDAPTKMPLPMHLIKKISEYV